MSRMSKKKRPNQWMVMMQRKTKDQVRLHLLQIQKNPGIMDIVIIRALQDITVVEASPLLFSDLSC